MNGFSAPIVCYLSLPAKLVDVCLFCIHIILIQVMWKNRRNELMHSKLWLDRKSNFLNPFVKPHRSDLTNCRLACGKLAFDFFDFIVVSVVKTRKRRRRRIKRRKMCFIHFPQVMILLRLVHWNVVPVRERKFFLHLTLTGTVQFQY